MCVRGVGVGVGRPPLSLAWSPILSLPLLLCPFFRPPGVCVCVCAFLSSLPRVCCARACVLCVPTPCPPPPSPPHPAHTPPPLFLFVSLGRVARARGRANAHTPLPPFIPLSHPPPRCLPPFSRGAGVGALCGDWGRGAGVRAPRCPPPLPPVCVVGFHLLKNQKKMKKGRTFCPRTRRVFVFCGRTLLERARACVCEGVALCNTQKEAPRGPVFFF